MKEYNKENIPLAKTLRRNMTPWERKLWYEFLRHYPVRFQRQKAIGDYIVDFYCAKARLVIELDGGGHYELAQLQADQLRTAELEHMKLSVVRICNLDIDNNFQGVCEYIDSLVRDSLPQSASLTAPSSEGALHQAKSVFALGFFDGVHLGHQALLNACKGLAAEKGCSPCAVTFVGHPDTLITGNTPKLLQSLEERCGYLERYGMEQVLKLPFDRALMAMPWQDFIAMLEKNGAVGFVCGVDFRFGHRGAGTAQTLAQYCREQQLGCVIVPEQLKNGIRISSTHIRRLIGAGEMEEAAAFLGHPHSLTGQVVAGRQLGRTMGIPTANVLIPEEVIVPRPGVYATVCRVDGASFYAVTNVGSRPTVGGHQLRTESWLLDFQGDLYGKELTVEFHQFLRPETKFSSLTELEAEIRKNEAETRKFFGK